MQTLKTYLSSVKALAGKNDKLICDLASGTKKWNMCVPPQPDDTDMALIELPRVLVPQLVSVTEILMEALENISSQKKWHINEDEMRAFKICDDFAKEALESAQKLIEENKETR